MNDSTDPTCSPNRRLSRRNFLSATAMSASAVPVVLSAEESKQAAPAASALSASSPAAAHRRATTYAEIGHDSWIQILSDKGESFIPPLTEHLPIQPVGNPDFIHLDSALNVCRRRVLPKLSTKDRPAVLAAREIETFIVQFALENPPIVPEMRASHLSLEEGKYPLARARYFSNGLVYEFDYFCRAAGERQSILWIVVTVTNEGNGAQEAHVRAKVNFQKESDLFEYHYQPFYWDASKWLPCEGVQLRENAIYRDSALIGKVEAVDWKLEWEEKKEFGGKPLRGRPHHVAPCMRLDHVQDVLHFSASMKQGEKKQLRIAVLTDMEGATDADRQHLMKAMSAEDRVAALTHFQSQFTEKHTQLLFPVEEWDQIFTALQLSTLQLCVQFPREKSLMPTQGGSSERHFVWVWEAMYMLMPMLRLGQFEVVRRSLDFIFSLQDSGNPPEGELTSTAGAVGTTGPKWLNTTGSALALASDYYLYTKDEKFLSEYLPKILKALGWIVGELRATRKLNADGSRPLYYGLMPFGCATDGDIGYIVSITDSFTFFGMEKAVALLERMQHERAEEFRKELESYRADLTRAIEGMTRPDGYIERKILTGRETKIQPGFERICGAMILAYTGLLDVRSERFCRYEEYVEKNLMDGFFVGKMDREIAYIGTGELPWHHAWLRRGEWKKAFAANRVNLRYGITQDAHQVQERFAKSNPAFVPWQPNGSGNGRILEMMLNSLYFEHDGMVTLLGGVPWLWLVENGTTLLRNLHTPLGSVSLEAQMTDREHCRVTLRASGAGVLPPLVRLPEHFLVSESNLQKQDHLFQVPDGLKELHFLLSEEAES